MQDLPGFRFYPTEEELISFYLHNKLEGRRDDLNRVMDNIIPVVDIYDFNPWDLPEYSGDMCNKDPEQWFFFIPRQESVARGGRPRRLTTTGYWKATGSPGHVYANNRIIGMKRTMVFYRGRAPSGRKTEWKMNEYKAIQEEASSSSSSLTNAFPTLRQEYSLCRIYKKSNCLRAFDRRPPAVDDTREMIAQGGVGATASSQKPLGKDDRIRSTESWSSGDHGNNPSQGTSQGRESSNMPMPTADDEHFLNWEQLDWYYGGDDNQEPQLN